MERTPIPGGFLIEMSPEEIQKLRRLNEISLHLGLTAVLVSRRESAVGSGEIKGLNNDIKSHIEAVNQLMARPQTRDQTS